MTLLATIHTTDVDLMAELLAACRSHGDVNIAYVDGGLEVRAGAAPTIDDPKASLEPCPHCGREFKVPQGRQRHIDSCGRLPTFDAQRARERAAEAL